MEFNTRIETLDENVRKEALSRLQSAMRFSGLHYVEREGFNYIAVNHAVDVTGACENVDTLVRMTMNNEEAFFNQTGQTALEFAVGRLGKVYTEIRSGRQEAKDDGRHLCEFALPELEFTYEGTDAEGFALLKRHIEGYTKALLEGALNRADLLEQLGADPKQVERMVSEPYGTISYDEAVNILGKQWGDDLVHEDEQSIVQRLGGRPTIIERYPEEIKFFNMKRVRDYLQENPGPEANGNPHLVWSTDCVFPYSGEAIGAAVREDDPKLLRVKLETSPMLRILQEYHGKDISAFNKYMNMVEENPTAHAGFGCGFPRVIQAALQAKSILYAVPDPISPSTKLNVPPPRKSNGEAVYATG